MANTDPLIEVAEETARAITEVLANLGITVATGKAGVLPPGTHALGILPLPVVVSKVSYVGGVSGANIFATTVKGANKLASLMGAGIDPDAEELSDIAQSAMGEAANQMLASAAAVTGTVLGRNIEIGPPETEVFTKTAPQATDHAAHKVTRVSFTVGDETCLFVQLIPESFLMRMSAAMADDLLEPTELDAEALVGAALGSAWLPGTALRLDAELGRAVLTADEVLGLSSGAVVVLDRAVDDPIELFVNGTAYASGRLLLDDGEWAVAIEELKVRPASDERSLDDALSAAVGDDVSGVPAEKTHDQEAATGDADSQEHETERSE
jgi:flagellar motor switch protein FliN/FliY